MKTKEYRAGQLKQIKLDDAYKVGVKFWDNESNSTNQLAITNEEFTQIKVYLLKKGA